MLFKYAEFFSLSATLHTQKNVKEIAYILTCYQALLKAQLFFLFIYILNKEKKKTIVDINFLFVCIFTHLIQFFTYIATFTQDHNKISPTQEHNWTRMKQLVQENEKINKITRL